MIPISIIIKGLYSYQEEQIVEFDKLLAGQIFGIFGSVGSGKSSILEAMAFALYGETERMNRADNRSYNMMNLKSNELWIDFQFKNYDDFIYRFTVRGKRHGKDFTKVGTFERSSYKLEGGQWVPLELKSAEEVLGLSYVNFRRTIIIPQGKFQEFLQLGDKARTDMLKEIFDLSKYEFFHQTANLERKNKDAIHVLQGQLLQFESIEKAYLDEKELRLRQIETSLKEQREILHKKTKELEALTLQKRQFDQKDELQKELDELLGREENVLELEKKVKDYEYCIIHFKDKLSRREEFESSLRQYAQQVDQAQQKKKEIEESLLLVKQELETAHAEYMRQEEYKDQVFDYTSFIRINSLEKSLGQIQNRIESGEIHVQNTFRELGEKQQTYESLKAEKREKQSALPDMMELSALQSWYDRKDALGQKTTELRARLKHEQDEAELLVKKIENQTADPLLVGIDIGEAPDFHSDAMSSLRMKLLKEQKLVQEQIDHLRLQTKLGEFATILKNGEACMLCGSVDHPHIIEIEDVEEHLREQEIRLMNLKEKDLALGKLIADLSYHKQNLVRSLKTIEDIELDVDKTMTLLADHRQLFKWNGFSEDKPDQLKKAYEQARALQTQISDAEKFERTLESEIEILRVNHGKYEKAVQGFTQDIIGMRTEHATLQSSLRRLRVEEGAGFEEAQLQEKIAILKRKIEDNAVRYEQRVDKRDRLNAELIGVQEQSEFLTTAMSDLADKNSYLNRELHDILDKSPFDTFESVKNILSQTLDAESIKKETSDYRQTVYSIRKQLEKITGILGDIRFDNERFLDLQRVTAQIQEKLEEEHTQYIKELSVFDRERSDFAKKKELAAAMGQLEKRAGNLDLLKKLFKGSGFVSYISSVYLQNLCHEANKRFYKLTNQQLQLEVDSNNNFQVRDFLNNGRVRSIKTLSGGQTFQASLSLALALAQSVQQQNKSKQNFFFLDEGFGSLDREALQTALATLKTLRKENRMVGVISHVEELQQEIDVCLNVRNDPVRGSLISGSWG